jgi:diaminopimelate epimerase
VSARDFVKYQALGNDYLVLEPEVFAGLELPAGIRDICDRHRGPGSDGILVDARTGEGSYALRIFNPDGSEAEKSGNGLRIFARHLFETEPGHPAVFEIATAGGVARATILDETASSIRVDMGSPDFALASLGIPPAGEAEAEIVDERTTFGGKNCRISCVSMGNPHCVVRDTAVDEATARRIGPLVENSRRFPKRINVQFLEVVSRGEIRIEIWERGAGYTLASGSSSCAAAAVARRLGLVDERVRVLMPGGALEVEFEEGKALMTGPVEKVYEGSFAPELRRRLGLPC